jgi:MFS family permease
MNSDPRSPTYRWAVLALIMTGTFMAILDTSIVNVALPHMMSAFGVNRNQIEWVTTGFMLATAMSMPLVGWLVGSAAKTVLDRATVLGFQNGFFLAGCIILLSLPLCLMLQDRKRPHVSSTEKK